MRVAIIGAGIVGVSTAQQLAAEGHEVCVFERSGSVAAEASFANAGVISPGAIALWPQAGPVSGWSAGSLGWRWQARRSQPGKAVLPQHTALQQLAAYSFEQQQQLRRQQGLDYEHTQGHLLLLRSARELQALQPGLERLQQLGIAHQLLDAQQCRRAEPGLNAELPVHGGLLMSHSEVGNCRQFALLLRQLAQRQGVRFLLHTQVLRIEAGSAPQLLHVRNPSGAGAPSPREADSTPGSGLTEPASREPTLERFDAIVVCAGTQSAALLQPLGLKLPMQALWGLSVTAALRQLEAHPDLGPRAAVTDLKQRATISRIGQRVRVAGGATLGGTAERLDPRAIERLHQVLHDCFPGATHSATAQHWKGARAALPDGAPLLGASGHEGIWLNCAHGDHGWALATGSARVLADQLSGRKPAVDVEALGPARLR